MTAVLPGKVYLLHRSSTNFDGRRTPYAQKVSIWPHQDRKSLSLVQIVSPRLRCGAAVNVDTSHAALGESDGGRVFSSTKSQVQMHFEASPHVPFAPSLHSIDGYRRSAGRRNSRSQIARIPAPMIPAGA